MDSKSRSKGPVPFQGIGTRLRRSRSREHSGDGDNLTDFDVRNTLRGYEFTKEQKNRSMGVGTLERPKRLMVSGRDYHDSTFIATPPNGQLSTMHHYGSRSRPNLY